MDNANRIELSQWVEGCTASLAPPADWVPNLSAARARFEARLRAHSTPVRYWLAGAAATSVAGAVFLVSPAARGLAEQCWQCITAGRIGVAQPLADRAVAPDFALKDADGRTVRLSDYRGKVVLLDFWATWCPPCRIEIPWFSELERKHRDKGFAVLGVSMDAEGWPVVRPFLAAFQVNYRVVIGDDETAQRFGGVAALPTTFLIDRDGKIAAVHSGLTSRQDFEDGVARLLR